MILTFLVIQVYRAIITYDTNLFTGFDYKADAAFVCASKTYTKSVTFRNICQHSEARYFYESKFFELSITSTTTIGFTLYINCPSGSRVYTIFIRWYAVDDPHVEVINSFNIANPTLTQTFSHTNTNAVYGFLSITSLKFTGPVNFKLSISSLTSSSITTTLTSNTNLAQIGYQIILGINRAYDIQGAQSSTANYTSSALNIKQNSWLFTPYSGFNFVNVNGIRLVITVTTTSTQKTYTLGNWDGIYISNTHMPVWFPYKYIVVDEAFKIEIYILELLKIFKQLHIKIQKLSYNKLVKHIQLMVYINQMLILQHKNQILTYIQNVKQVKKCPLNLIIVDNVQTINHINKIDIVFEL